MGWDVEELLAERGIAVDHVTVYQWVQRFTPEFIEAARPCRHAPGDRWFADETYVKVTGAWTYLYRAVDQYGQVIDVLLSGRRDLAAARRFFTPALRAGTVPAEVTTDRAEGRHVPSAGYPRIRARPGALHLPPAGSGGGSFRRSEVTPGGRELPDADGAADLLGGHADRLGEGRVGELHLGELLDVHARAHGGRDDLDGFG